MSVKCQTYFKQGDKAMAIIGMRELLRDPTKVFSTIDESREPVLVTNRGRPVAALYPVDANQAEELMLANAPEYVASRRDAEYARSEGRTRSLEEAIEEHNASAEPDDRVEPDDTGSSGDAVSPSSPSPDTSELVPMAELQAIFGAELGSEVADETRRRVSAISEALVDSAETAGLLETKAGGGVEDREEIVERIAKLSAQLLSEVMREVLLQAASERVSALGAEPEDLTYRLEPEGIFGRQLAEETIEAAAAYVEQFNGEILSVAPSLEAGGLLPTYDASVKAASAFGFGRGFRVGVRPTGLSRGLKSAVPQR